MSFCNSNLASEVFCNCGREVEEVELGAAHPGTSSPHGGSPPARRADPGNALGKLRGRWCAGIAPPKSSSARFTSLQNGIHIHIGLKRRFKTVSFFMEGIGIWLRVQWELLMSIPRRSQRWQLRTALFPVLGAAPWSGAPW